jgi:hypothetical protein
MSQEPQIKPQGYVAINGDLGFFIDESKYAPILKINDEAAVLLRLSLLIENFLEVFIKNVRRPGTEDFVKPVRYFKPKVELSVALGLPISIANALLSINSVRNKFAHNIDYVMTVSDYDEIESSVNTIDIETVNPLNRFSMESIQYMFEAGVDSLMFVRNLNYSTPDKQRQLFRLVGAVFILANKCAFFTLNELQRQGRLSFGQPMSDQKP